MWREDDLAKVVDLLVKEGPARGLVLSTTITSPSSPKTTVWSPLGEVENCDVLAALGVVVVEAEGVVLLGAPLGSQGFMEEEVARKVHKVKEVSQRLALLEDLQGLLRHSKVLLPALHHGHQHHCAPCPGV